MAIYRGDKVAWAVWVTGLPGSGKSTVARNMAQRLKDKGVKVRVLEMDAVRKVLTPHPSYSLEERSVVYAAIAYMAKLLVDEGVNVIIDATGNLKKYRDVARGLIPKYGEIYVQCPIELCMEREASRKGGHAPHGIYNKGMTGGSSTVPGVNVPYEAPEHPVAVVDTEKESRDRAGIAAVDALMKWADEHGG
jgi:adenylylsulfate kinase